MERRIEPSDAGHHRRPSPGPQAALVQLGGLLGCSRPFPGRRPNHDLSTWIVPMTGRIECWKGGGYLRNHLPARAKRVK